MLNKFIIAAAIGAAVTAPAFALNPQPEPPGRLHGTTATGEPFLVSQDHLILGAGAMKHRAKAGTYKLSTGQTVTVDATGKFTSETLKSFPSLGRAELNPQPLPP